MNHYYDWERSTYDETIRRLREDNAHTQEVMRNQRDRITELETARDVARRTVQKLLAPETKEYAVQIARADLLNQVEDAQSEVAFRQKLRAGVVLLFCIVAVLVFLTIGWWPIIVLAIGSGWPLYITSRRVEYARGARRARRRELEKFELMQLYRGSDES